MGDSQAGCALLGPLRNIITQQRDLQRRVQDFLSLLSKVHHQAWDCTLWAKRYLYIM